MQGTLHLVDAAKKAGVKKFVLMSSLLTNGRAAGQGANPNFVILNLFGGVLDEKLKVTFAAFPILLQHIVSVWDTTQGSRVGGRVQPPDSGLLC